MITLQFGKPDQSGPGVTMNVARDRDGLYLFVWLDEEGGERLSFRRTTP